METVIEILKKCLNCVENSDTSSLGSVDNIISDAKDIYVNINLDSNLAYTMYR